MIPAERRERVLAIALSRRSFRSYISFVHGWELRPHQLIWVEALQALAEGTLTDEAGKPCYQLLIMAPPASGKTALLTEYVEWLVGREWRAGRDPQVGIISYADDVAIARSKSVRHTVEYSKAYKDVFPGIVPAYKEGWNEHAWNIQRQQAELLEPQATVRGIGMTGAIKSHRFKTLIVIDDPHKTQGILTANEKQETYLIYSQYIKTRGSEITPIVMITTRDAEDDLPGRVMKAETGWRVIRTPALGEDGSSYWPLEVDEMGVPNGISVAELERIRLEEPDRYLTQMQCLPPTVKNDVFKYWVRRPWPEADNVSRVYHAWDTAFTTKSNSDYSAMVEGVKTKDGYLIITKAWKGRLDYIALKLRARELAGEAWDKWGMVPFMIVENKSSGPALVADLRATTDLHVVPWDPPYSRDLIERSNALSPHFEAGRVALPIPDGRFFPWERGYLYEMESFPAASDDDYVAATIALVEYTMGYGVRKALRTKFRWGSW